MTFRELAGTRIPKAHRPSELELSRMLHFVCGYRDPSWGSQDPLTGQSPAPLLIHLTPDCCTRTGPDTDWDLTVVFRILIFFKHKTVTTRS